MGQRNKDIAKALDLHPVSVCNIIKSPLFQTRKAELLEQVKGATVEDLLTKIRSEAIPNFDFLVHLRDHADDEKTALGAARQIASETDRVWPKRTEHSEDRTIRLVVDDESLRRMSIAMAEAKGIEGAPLEAVARRVVPANSGFAEHQTSSPEEFLHELEVAAAQELEAAHADEER
jgi:hypothetical protein